MLFDSPLSFVQVSWQVIFGVVVVSVLFFVFAIGMAVKTARTKPTTGKAGLIGEIGEVYKSLNPTGTVKLHGEYWKAVCDKKVSKGKRIKVIAFDSEHFELKVEPIE